MNILCLNTAFAEAHIALSYNGKNFYKTIDADITLSRSTR